MIFRKWKGRAMCAALVAASLGACDFIEPTTEDPNRVPNANVDQLFTAAQVNSFAFNENQIARLAAMWTQQLAGTDRQFQILDNYIFDEEEADGEMASIYTLGGLIDIRQAIAQAEAADRRVYAGILRIHEAFLVGMGASIFGDLPYSEAVAGDPTPKLDDQAAVYAQVQSVLDAAIADLQSGTGSGPGAVDFNFAGSAARWIAVANSLKARFYMHWVEAQGAGGAAAGLANTACGGNCVQKALAAAQNGIKESAGNWRGIHSTTSTENNFWHQFNRDRSGYVSGGAFLINLLNNGTPAVFTDDDPRLAFYFTRGSGSFAGQYIGSPPSNPAGDPGANSSQINPAGPAAAAYNQPIVSCAETQFIIAEAQFRLGNAAAARAAVDAGRACSASERGVTLPALNSTASGQALLEQIINQKYIALFLNMEVWNDYKRTCLPAIQPVAGKRVPARLFYGQTERQTNSLERGGHIPPPDQQPARNDNDPNPCT